MKNIKMIVVVLAMLALCVTMTPSLSAAMPGAGGQGSSQGGGPSGKVLQTMDAGGYTYAEIDTGNGNVWVAIPQAKIKVGQTITFQPGMPMTNFKSKSLGRTFEVIYFCGGIQE